MNEMAIPPIQEEWTKLWTCICVFLCIFLSFCICLISERFVPPLSVELWSSYNCKLSNLRKKLSSRINKKRWCGETKGTITIMMRIMLMLVSMKLSMITWGGGLRSWTPIFVFPGSSLDYNIIIYFDYITITRSTSSRSEDTLIQVRRSSEMPLSANDIRIRIRRWTLKLWL